MMLIDQSIKNPVKVSVAVVLIVLFGLLSLGSIPIQLTPNVDKQVVTVTTRWEGASPEEIERDIIEEQEEKAKVITGLVKMTSECTQGTGTLTLEFELGTDKNDALREVSDKMREVPDYPENVDEPVIEAGDPNNRDYIAWVIFSTTDPNYDVRQLQDFAEDFIKPELKRVPGVSEVNVIGGWEREAQVRYDPLKLALRGLNAAELIAALQRENRSISAGQIAEGKSDIRLRLVNRYDSIEQVEDTIISPPNSPVVYLKDVAEVVQSYKKADRIVRSKGRVVLAVNAQREPGSNVMAVMEEFRKRVKWVDESLLPTAARRFNINGEFHFNQVYDQTIYIDQAINLVTTNLWIGGVLAVLVLLLFLRQLTATMIVALSIPVSVIGTFLAMVVMGRNLNVVSLAGMAFAVGMVVDNAIVVLENIDRHRLMGKSPGKAAFDATREVWGAVLASTLTTLCVFIPILTIQEEAGQLFRDLALAICAAVTLSLIVSITVIPTASAKLMKPEKEDKGTMGRAVDQLFGLRPIAGQMAAFISYMIGKLSRGVVMRPILIVTLTVLSLAGSYLMMPPASYLPSGNRNLVFAMLFPPPGYNLEQQQRIGLRIEETVSPFFDTTIEKTGVTPPPIDFVNQYTGETGKVEVPKLDNFFFVGAPNMMFMGAISSDDQRVDPVQKLLNKAAGKIEGVFGIAIQVPLFRTARRGSGTGIEIELSGPNLSELEPVAGELFGRYRERYGQVQPTPSNFSLPGPEVVVTANHVKAKDMGLDNQALGRIVQTLGEGAIIGDYVLEGDNIDLSVKAQGVQEKNDAKWMLDIPIATPSGEIVPLSTVANIKRRTAPEMILRIEEQRAITLQVTVADMPLETAMNEIQADLDAMRESGKIPPTVRTNLTGTAAKLKNVREALLGEWTGFNKASFGSLAQSRMFLALLVTYLLMAALFESWIYPLVILFSVPLATVGGFFGLALVRVFIDPAQQLDVLTMLGFVILTGIVVNNAILIVHQTLNILQGKADVDLPSPVSHHDAIAESVKSRVRPIFMSMLTSVGGMLPLVLFPGSGSELYRGLGSVVVGGLFVSTVFTLLLVPLLLSVLFDIKLKLGRSVV